MGRRGELNELQRKQHMMTGRDSENIRWALDEIKRLERKLSDHKVEVLDYARNNLLDNADVTIRIDRGCSQFTLNTPTGYDITDEEYLNHDHFSFADCVKHAVDRVAGNIKYEDDNPPS